MPKQSKASEKGLRRMFVSLSTSLASKADFIIQKQIDFHSNEIFSK